MNSVSDVDVIQMKALLGLADHPAARAVINRASRDPLFLHHLIVTRGTALSQLLLKEVSSEETSAKPSTEQRSNLAWQAAWKLARAAFSQEERVEREVYDLRLQVCYDCPHLKMGSKTAVAVNAARCGLCGCFVRAKAWLRRETCPDRIDVDGLNRWERQFLSVRSST